MLHSTSKIVKKLTKSDDPTDWKVMADMLTDEGDEESAEYARDLARLLEDYHDLASSRRHTGSDSRSIFNGKVVYYLRRTDKCVCMCLLTPRGDDGRRDYIMDGSTISQQIRIDTPNGKPGRIAKRLGKLLDLVWEHR